LRRRKWSLPDHTWQAEPTHLRTLTVRSSASYYSAVNLFSLFIVTLVLVAQTHADELNARRDNRTLKLAILSERKIAKVIELLEELRRDSPQVQDRVDRQADQMAQPAERAGALKLGAAISEAATDIVTPSAAWQRPRSRQDIQGRAGQKICSGCNGSYLRQLHPSRGHNTMAKELEMNDNSTQDQDRQPQQLSGDRPNQHKLLGKALQVNENSVEDQCPPGHQCCCGEEPGASAPARNFREKLSRSTKAARKTKGRWVAPDGRVDRPPHAGRIKP
jgi:hypothetical protein